MANVNNNQAFSNPVNCESEVKTIETSLLEQVVEASKLLDMYGIVTVSLVNKSRTKALPIGCIETTSASLTLLKSVKLVLATAVAEHRAATAHFEKWNVKRKGILASFLSGDSFLIKTSEGLKALVSSDYFSLKDSGVNRIFIDEAVQLSGKKLRDCIHKHACSIISNFGAMSELKVCTADAIKEIGE